MPRQAFTIGRVPPGSCAVPIYQCDELENVPIGAVIAPLNDYLMVWDQDCLPPTKLEPWRHLGDPLCDNVVRALGLRAGQDGLQRILEHLDLPVTEQSLSVRQFWNEIARDPPPDVTALPPAQVRAATDYIVHPSLRSPDFRPSPTLSQGQAVFWRYSVQIFSALLHFSLAGGFSANRIMNVLRETSYLTGEERDRTYKRLLETTQAIMDYMNDMTPITGVGWKSAIRVRLLHSSVRVRISDGKGTQGTYDEKVDGIPINQEDLLATLGSFAIAPLWSLRRMGFHLSAEEELAYVSAWRHIGYYLGIPASRLSHHYSCVRRAEKLFASMTMHLFSSDYITFDYRSTHTYRLLSAVARRPPRNASVESSMATSRFLLGDGLADRLALPPTPRWMQLKMHAGFMLERWLKAFGRHWRTGWEVERTEITRMLVLMIVCWQLGERRTKFTIKEFAYTLERMDVEGEKQALLISPQPAQQNLDADNDELDPDVKLGPAAGRAMVKRWKWLLAEMGGVVILVGAVSCGAAYVGARYLLS